MKRIIIFFFLLLFLVASLVALQLFVIGEIANADTLAIRVEEGDGQLTIYIQTTDSALALSDLTFHYEDTVLHLTVREVLVSPLYSSGEKCLYYEITDESEIHLNGKLIWTKP